MTQIAIRAEHLTRVFRDLRAVDDITFEVPTGIVFGFLGPNGAGKTTTIRLLLGLLEPTAGRAEVLGHDTRAQADAIRQKTGALLEHSGLYERLSAEDNLEFYGRVARLSGAARQARLKELLEPLGLWERRKEIVAGWSRGMKQKLAVARALFHRPALVFLDEPTASLDPVASAALRDELAALAAREGVTVFLTTHNLAEAEKLCQQVGVIRKGKLQAIGTPDQLRAQTGRPHIEISGTGFTAAAIAALQARPEVAGVQHRNNHLVIALRQATEAAPLVNLLVAQGVQVEEVKKGAADLEEVFLTLMEEEAKA